MLLLGRLQLDLLLSLKQKGDSRGVATNTCDEELELAPTTGFILSTCTEVEKINAVQKNIAAQRIGNIAASKICYRHVVAIHNTIESVSRHLFVGRFRVLEFCGLLKKHLVQCNSRICFENRITREFTTIRGQCDTPTTFPCRRGNPSVRCCSLPTRGSPCTDWMFSNRL